VPRARDDIFSIGSGTVRTVRTAPLKKKFIRRTSLYTGKNVSNDKFAKN